MNAKCTHYNGCVRVRRTTQMVTHMQGKTAADSQLHACTHKSAQRVSQSLLRKKIKGRNQTGRGEKARGGWRGSGGVGAPSRLLMRLG